ncbi:MAG: ATP synthase F0 subunit B [Deltaproteobacteria bacterium]
MFDLDFSLVYQIISYIVLLFVLNRFLYKPIQNILRERKERTDGALKDASQLVQDVADGLVSYDMKIKEAVVKGTEEKNKLRKEAEEQGKAVIERVGEKNAEEFAVLRRTLADGKRSALAALRTDAAAISREIAEKLLNRKTAAVVFMLILPFLPSMAFGSTEEGGHQGIDKMRLLWSAINFAVLGLVIVVIWIKVINKLLDKRSVDIKKAIGDAVAAKEAAEKKAEDYRAQLDNLDSRIAEVIDTLKREGAAEKERLLKEAGAAAQKFASQAKLVAEQEVKNAKKEMKKEALIMAIKMAEEILKKEVKSEDQKRLVKGCIDGIRLN